ncbi:hypothetical protein [Paenibacillus sp. UMB4589-SE434]|uniref:hypothetical protein n=1 Tax=Paenibacillus sp. UMB4589-SE434 TaxID=3046314 RepID=UPI00254D23BA|nr:hypothetical protein [Paenibacillus sp. UMB4589-SE434]MDK8181025.1 hypothetical protein [Paenibacillus sp. UMB4589-SE434]
MKWFGPKLFGLLGLLALGIWIGMELTQSGIERVYGPMATTSQQTVQSIQDTQHAQTRDITLPADRKSIQEGSRTKSQRTDEEVWTEDENREDGSSPVGVHEPDIQRESNSQPPAEDAPVNKLADKTAGILQQLSEAGIQAVVGLFSGLF